MLKSIARRILMRLATVIVFKLFCLFALLPISSDLIFALESTPVVSGSASHIPNMAGRPTPPQTTLTLVPQTHPDKRTENDKKSFIEKFANNISAMCSIIFNFLIVLPLLIAFFIAVVWEMRRYSVVIDPIDVPKDLAEKGYTSQAVAQRLAAEINEIQLAARLSGRLIEEGFELSATQIDFTVPTAGISYRNLVRYVRQILRRPEQRIQGEIVREIEGMRIVYKESQQNAEVIRIALRTIEGHMTPSDLWVASEGELNKLIEKAAFEITFLVDPYLHATYCLWTEERERKFEKTLKAVSRCLTHTSSKRHHRAYVIRGIVFAFQRKFDQAEEQFRIAASLKPRYSSTFINWGHLKRTMRRFDDAAEMYEWARRLGRRAVYAWHNLGNVCCDRRKFRKALGYYKRAVRLNPRYANAWQGWGWALFKLGYYCEAEAKFARAVDLNPEFGWSYFNWALSLRNLRRFEEAIDKVGFAAKHTSIPAQAYALCGMCQ
jgi:tetratricopeptide (TPR) repeat protein